MKPPLKSGALVTGHWRNINALQGGQQFRAAQADSFALRPQSVTDGRKRRMFAPEPMFPFRLYQLPPWYRSAPNPATDWLKFCVRSGAVFVNFVQITPTGTDSTLSTPDQEAWAVTSGAGTNEISCTANVPQFWFWLVITAGAVSLGSGTAPPAWSTGAIPIGYVDTQTNYAAKVPIVRQLVRTDLFVCL